MSKEKRVFLTVGLVIFTLFIGLATHRYLVEIPKEKAERMEAMHKRIAAEKIEEENYIYKGVKEFQRIFRHWEHSSAEERVQIYAILKKEINLSPVEETALLTGGDVREIPYRIIAKKFNRSVDEVHSIVNKKEIK